MPVDLIDPKTRKRVPVPEEDVAAAYRSGLVFPKGAQIPVVNQAGDVGTIDEKDAGAAFDAGVRIAAPEEIQKAKDDAAQGAARERFGAHSTLGKVAEGHAANAAGVARGLTAGLSDAAILGATHALAGDETAEKARSYLDFLRKEHPNLSTAGEAEGMVAPLLVPGAGEAAEGAGAALRGATALERGVGAIPRGVSAAGEAAGRLAESVTGGKATSAIGRVAQGALKGATTAATEGAIYGAGHQVGEAALGDTDLTAEKVLAGAGHEALAWGEAGGLLGATGAALGAGRDAAGRFLGQLRPKDVEALAEKQFGYAAPGLGEAAKEWFSKAASAVSGEDAGAIRELIERRHEIAQAPAVRDEAARTIRTELDALLDSTRELVPEARGPLKAEYVRRAVERGNEALTTEATAKSLGGLRDELRGMSAEPKQFGERRLLQNATEYVNAAVARAETIAANGGKDVNAQLFTLVDDTKRAIGRWTKGLQAVERKADALELLKGRATRDKFMGFYEDLRKGLESRELWGRAAEDQARINDAWTKQIDAHRVFDAKLTTNVGRDPKNPWVDIRRVDPGKVDSYVSGLTNPKNDLVHTAIGQYVASTRDLARAIGESYELPAAKLEHVHTIGRSAEAFGRNVDRAAKALTLANQFEAMRRVEGGAGVETASAVLGALGHPVAGLVGEAIGALGRPAQTIGRLAAIERLVNKVDLRVDGSVRGFLRSSGRVAATGAKGASRAARLATTEASTEAEFRRTTRRVAELASNPDLQTQKTADSLAGLDRSAPRTSTAIAAQTARVTGFLAMKLPETAPNPYPLGGTEPPPVSDAERARWARYYTAATAPLTVLEDLEHGRITPEQVEAMRACYPRLYEQVRNNILERGAKAASALNYGQRVTLGVLFDAPTDATLEPAFLRAIATAVPPAEEPEGRATGGPPGKPLNVADPLRTDMQAAAEHGGQ